MPRRLPLDKPHLPWPAARPTAPQNRTLLAVEIAVVTPLFGGGPTARTADLLNPVRGAAVRGHLRFWWRACRAVSPAFATARQLFAAEAAIWGSTAHPAAVEVAIDLLDPGHSCPATAYVEHRGQQQPGVRYALFPFLDLAAGADGPVNALEGVRFQLTLAASPDTREEERPRLKREVEAALFAWLTFGGLGARTRRGCGSLYCDDPRFAPPRAADVDWWLTAQVGADWYVRPGDRTLPIPVLSGARLVVGDEARPLLVAWNAPLRRLREIRQEPGIARNRGRQANRPGRSKWPEPDSVRETLGLHDPRHRPEHPARPYFPRADLGLPLIFQRMDRPEPRLEAAGEGATRFASPFIFKALALSPTHAVPLVLCLNAPHVWEGPGVVLKHGARSIPVPPAQLDDTAKARAAALVLPELRGDARATALAYVARCWGRPEVTLP